MCWLSRGGRGGGSAAAVQAIVCRGLSVISPIACEMGHRSRRDAFARLSRVGEGGAKNKGRERGRKKTKNDWRSPSERTSPLRPPLQDAEVTLGKISDTTTGPPRPPLERRSRQVSGLAGDADARASSRKPTEGYAAYVHIQLCMFKSGSGAGGSAHLKNQSLLKPAKTEELI